MDPRLLRRKGEFRRHALAANVCTRKLTLLFTVHEDGYHERGNTGWPSAELMDRWHEGCLKKPRAKVAQEEKQQQQEPGAGLNSRR